MEKIKRNDKCPCNSGKKFKNCHSKLYRQARAADIQNKYLVKLAAKAELL